MALTTSLHSLLRWLYCLLLRAVSSLLHWTPALMSLPCSVFISRRKPFSLGAQCGGSELMGSEVRTTAL